MNFTDLLNFLNELITIVSLIISVWALRIARFSDRSVKEMHRIAGSISTKYVGTFPNQPYTDELVKLINGTRKELLMLSTLPVHAAYTAHAAWKETSHAIDQRLAACPELKIKCSFGEPQVIDHLINVQFEPHLTDDSTWQKYRDLAKNQEILKNLPYDYFGGRTDIKLDQFRKFFQETAGHLKDTIYNHPRVEQYQFKGQLSFNAWIADGRIALFVIVSAAHFDSRMFKTYDDELIDTLKIMMRPYMTERYVPTPKIAATTTVHASQ